MVMVRLRVMVGARVRFGMCVGMKLRVVVGVSGSRCRGPPSRG